MTDFAKRPTVAEVDLSRLRFNFRSARDFIGHDVKYMAVVKANAYGHGAVECSRALVEEGVQWLGVAIVEEALELRNAGVEIPILCLGGLFPGQERITLKQNITPTVLNVEQAVALNTAARAENTKAPFHLKIDTGMGRLGIRWDDVESFIAQFGCLNNIHLEGLMSHFAAANDPSERAFTNQQIDRFHEAIGKLEASGYVPEVTDIANSPGAVGHPRARPRMVRLGGILYGLASDILDRSLPQPELRPVLSLHSAIADVKRVLGGETLGYGRSFTTSRDSTIALVPIGYNDGYERSFSNNAFVLVNGRVAPVVGRISMDWTIVDITDVPGAKIGDRVTLIGHQGEHRVGAEDLARIAGTISYEITCGIGERVPRSFVQC